ncbi:MAG: DUF1275 domain-containing protein [Labilithrix sp.]|nr:DUF1275 domain-containing protein [Labilithrix sp.]MCW5817362.1 DUF1275 domain-containing protein [Labilithrix sp.]
MAFTAAAGFVNAATFMGSNRVVSHVTGSVTSVATERSLALHITAIVLAFIGGGMLAVFAAEKLKQKPLLAYALPALGACGVLLAVALAGHAGAFGEFGEENDVTGSVFPMLALLALAMGMINAAVAASTASRIRVTHMTGPATDLAGHVVRSALRSGKDARNELRWAWLRFGKILSFVAGGALAAKTAHRFEYGVFVIAATILLVAIALTVTPTPVEQPSHDVHTRRPAPAR